MKEMSLPELLILESNEPEITEVFSLASTLLTATLTSVGMGGGGMGCEMGVMFDGIAFIS